MSSPPASKPPTPPAILYRDRIHRSPSQLYYLPPAIDPTPFLTCSSAPSDTTAQNSHYARRLAFEICSLDEKLSRALSRREIHRTRLYGPVAYDYTPGTTPEDVRRSCYERGLREATTRSSLPKTLTLLRQRDLPSDLLLSTFRLCTRLAAPDKLKGEEAEVFVEVKDCLKRLGMLDEELERESSLVIAEVEVEDDTDEAVTSAGSDWVFS